MLFCFGFPVTHCWELRGRPTYSMDWLWNDSIWFENHSLKHPAKPAQEQIDPAVSLLFQRDSSVNMPFQVEQERTIWDGRSHPHEPLNFSSLNCLNIDALNSFDDAQYPASPPKCFYTLIQFRQVTQYLNRHCRHITLWQRMESWLPDTYACKTHQRILTRHILFPLLARFLQFLHGGSAERGQFTFCRLQHKQGERSGHHASWVDMFGTQCRVTNTRTRTFAVRLFSLLLRNTFLQQVVFWICECVCGKRHAPPGHWTKHYQNT